jgi:dolichol-phosphate mannosyltransferase
MKIAIIIPTFNEKANIINLVKAVQNEVKSVEVIVVDDNSPDGTSQEVAKAKSSIERLHLISRNSKDGRGSAVLEGFNYALSKLGADIMIEMDADFSHDPHELPKIIALSKPNNIVLASRYIPKSKIYNWPYRRVTSSKMANFLIKLILNLPTKDNTNGYRCYQKQAVELLLKHAFISKGYILLSESQRYLYERGFKLVETPSVFRNRKVGKSKATFREFFYSLYLLFQIRLRTNGKEN